MSRRKAREETIKLLFEMEIRGEDYQQMLEYFFKNVLLEQEEERYIRNNVKGVFEHLEEIDTMIKSKLVNWTIGRIPKVDLAILRNALFEIVYCEDVPPGVAINEAVELAKKYSNADSSIFINGILGSIVREMNNE